MRSKITTIEEFYSDSSRIIEEFNSFVKRNKLEKRSIQDHICYKCSSLESFEYLRKLFEFESDFAYQSIISKRRIAIIKFKKGIDTILGPIYYLELSDQKPDASQKEGFDHVETVPKGISYDEFVKHIGEKEKNLIKVERPHHTTYDVELESGFSIKLSREPLLEKIKREEMK